MRRRRRELHGAIARVLVERFHDLAETQPELLALHYTEAGEAEPAVRAWQRAAERARARGALDEAVSQLRRGLAVLATLPESPARGEQEFRLQLLLGQALMLTQAFASPEVVEALARARVLSATFGDPRQVAVLLGSLTVSAMYRDGPEAGRPLADEALAAAERTGRPSLLLFAHTLQGMGRLFAGDLAGARDHCGCALSVYGEAAQLRAPPQSIRIPTHRIAPLHVAALTAWHLGRTTERARTRTRPWSWPSAPDARLTGQAPRRTSPSSTSFSASPQPYASMQRARPEPRQRAWPARAGHS